MTQGRFMWAGKNPVAYLKNTLEALVTAFGTDSSTATLPVTMKCQVRAATKKLYRCA